MVATLLSKNAEVEQLGGGQTRLTVHQHPIAFDDGGVLRRIAADWVDLGTGDRPQIVTDAPLQVSVANDGARRIHPTREAGKYAEIGAPYLNISGTWTKISLGAPTRSAHRLTWITAQADVIIEHHGHAVKLWIRLKGGWTPPNNQVAFPVDLVGLTRSGANIQDGGVTVMKLVPPDVHDENNPTNKLDVAWSFVSRTIGGVSRPVLLMTLPDVSGMGSPILDPTITLQPDATAGLDTLIQQVGPTTNFGTLDSIIVGNRTGVAGPERSLIKFDLSTLPSDAVISSATLSLYHTAGDAGSLTIEVFRVKRDWVESQATWNIWKTSNNWQTAGCGGADDVESTAIGSLSVPNTNGFHDWALTPTTKADLDLGNGWLLKGTDEVSDFGKWFASSDNATAANRPKLVIIYTVPPTQQSAAGTVTPAGTVTTKTKTQQAGTVTPAGSLNLTIKISLSGALAPAGSLSQTTKIALAGSVSPAGTVNLKAMLVLSGSITPAGSLVQKAKIVLAGVLTPAGALIQKTKISLSGVLTPAGTLEASAITPPAPVPLTLNARSTAWTLMTRSTTWTLEDRP